MENKNIKTSYNRLTFLVALLISNIGLLGIVSAFFLQDYKVVQFCILMASAVWIISCEFIAIREMMTYDEIKGDEVTISRIFKVTKINVKDINKVIVDDRVIFIIKYTGKKLCSIDSFKPNAMKFVDALVERGIPKELR